MCDIREGNSVSRTSQESKPWGKAETCLSLTFSFPIPSSSAQQAAHFPSSSSSPTTSSLRAGHFLSIPKYTPGYHKKAEIRRPTDSSRLATLKLQPSSQRCRLLLPAPRPPHRLLTRPSLGCHLSRPPARSWTCSLEPPLASLRRSPLRCPRPQPQPQFPRQLRPSNPNCSLLRRHPLHLQPPSLQHPPLVL